MGEIVETATREEEFTSVRIYEGFSDESAGSGVKAVEIALPEDEAPAAAALATPFPALAADPFPALAGNGGTFALSIT